MISLHGFASPLFLATKEILLHIADLHAWIIPKQSNSITVFSQDRASSPTERKRTSLNASESTEPV